MNCLGEGVRAVHQDARVSGIRNQVETGRGVGQNHTQGWMRSEGKKWRHDHGYHFEKMCLDAEVGVGNLRH